MQKILSFFPALQNKNYRLFWITGWIALVGFWVQLTAQQWLVYRMTDSAILLGTLSAFQFLPSLLFTLFSGVWIDQHNKRKILVATQAIYIIESALLGLLLFFGYENYYWLLFFAFFCGTIDAFDMPARLAFMPELVGPKALHSAISLNSANFNITRMVGPVLAAFLLTYLSYSSVFFLYALSIIPILWTYHHINVNSVPYTGRKKHPLKEIIIGLKVAKNNSIILCDLIGIAIVSGLVLNFSNFAPLFSDRVLNKGLSGFSTILFFVGMGAMLSGLFSATSQNYFSQKKIFIIGLICGFLLILISLTSSFLPAMILFTLLGGAVILFIVNCNTAIQMATPAEYTGRIMGLYTFVFLGVAPFGSLFTGFILEIFGTARGMGIIGWLNIFCLLALGYYYKKLNKIKKPL